MPELPDIEAYRTALETRLRDARLDRIRVVSPFLVRSVDPPLADAEGRRVTAVSRLGKRLVVGLEGELSLVLHLMIAGRLRWAPRGARVPGRVGLAAFDFSAGTLVLTEASPRKRAALHLVHGAAALAAHDRGGLEVLDAAPEAFAAALRRERHTLKRALTDPRLFSGIGNAYADEILHRARLSPVQLTTHLDDGAAARLCDAARSTLREWTDRLCRDASRRFPERVTAFRPGMAVHGRFGQPCPACGHPVQRIRYAENETNYCAHCQTGGVLLADRALSRLLKDDWPRRLEEMESGAAPAAGTADGPGARGRRR